MEKQSSNEIICIIKKWTELKNSLDAQNSAVCELNLDLKKIEDHLETFGISDTTIFHKSQDYITVKYQTNQRYRIQQFRIEEIEGD
jgi:hypothetical protein